MNFGLQNNQNSGIARCEVGWNWNPAPLGDYDLWYVVAGRGEMRLNGQVHPIRPGACFLVHPGDKPSAEQDLEHRLTVIFIHFDVYTLGKERSTITPDLLPERVAYIEDTAEFERLLHQALDCRYQQDAWSEQEFDSAIKQVLIRMYRSRRQSSDTASALSHKQRQAVSRIMHRIQEEGGRRLPHEELAELVGLTPAYMNKIFKQYTGTSVKEYITRIRLQRAKHLLTETTMNVSQVSDALGYASIFLFSKQFKKQFGEPPSAFSLKSDPPQSHPLKRRQ
ncbi:AraC family transcriptional regulator [Paenibacillus koleovorans]|uniref:AraC family transcriptional regulator n=1 Tax=Paenibacillus koleovorans TaxID=121608 RepID=UPI0013E2CA1F|nr:AraC family transcriptional regulator [Paenibacillus koleovorans]